MNVLPVVCVFSSDMQVHVDRGDMTIFSFGFGSTKKKGTPMPFSHRIYKYVLLHPTH